MYTSACKLGLGELWSNNAILVIVAIMLYIIIVTYYARYNHIHIQCMGRG